MQTLALVILEPRIFFQRSVFVFSIFLVIELNLMYCSSSPPGDSHGHLKHFQSPATGFYKRLSISSIHKVFNVSLISMLSLHQPNTIETAPVTINKLLISLLVSICVIRHNCNQHQIFFLLICSVVFSLTLSRFTFFHPHSTKLFSRITLLDSGQSPLDVFCFLLVQSPDRSDSSSESGDRFLGQV